jgi:hypothetical protein
MKQPPGARAFVEVHPDTCQKAARHPFPEVIRLEKEPQEMVLSGGAA